MPLSSIKGRNNYYNDTNFNNNNVKKIIMESIKERKKMDKEYDCPICLNQIIYEDEIYITYCLHKFHKQCILQWKSIRNSCPMCRHYL